MNSHFKTTWICETYSEGDACHRCRVAVQFDQGLSAQDTPCSDVHEPGTIVWETVIRVFKLGEKFMFLGVESNCSALGSTVLKTKDFVIKRCVVLSQISKNTTVVTSTVAWPSLKSFPFPLISFVHHWTTRLFLTIPCFSTRSQSWLQPLSKSQDLCGLLLSQHPRSSQNLDGWRWEPQEMVDSSETRQEGNTQLSTHHLQCFTHQPAVKPTSFQPACWVEFHWLGGQPEQDCTPSDVLGVFMVTKDNKARKANYSITSYRITSSHMQSQHMPTQCIQW